MSDTSGISRHLIIGAGSVGQGFASFLHQGGGDVLLVARGDTAAALRRGGLWRDGVLGTHTMPPGSFRVADSLALVPAIRFDAIFVCVKSYDSAGVAAALAERPDLLRAGTSVVLCQNGWGNAEEFARFLPTDGILNARIITGFDRPVPAEPNRVRVTVHAQPVRVGSLFSRQTGAAGAVSAALAAGGLPCDATDCIERDLWEKMCFNCSLNPLGAIFRTPLGELVTCPGMCSLIDSLVGEIFDVMHASGYRTHARTAAEHLDTFYRKLVPATASHRSSMLQDILDGRRTEIDALNGAVVRLGEPVGVDVTYNRVVHALVTFAETRPRLARRARPDPVDGAEGQHPAAGGQPESRRSVPVLVPG
jgi:2-dehydropantoate 2-reductase